MERLVKTTQFFKDCCIAASYSDLKASYSAHFPKDLYWFPCNNKTTVALSSYPSSSCYHLLVLLVGCNILHFICLFAYNQ